MKSIFRLLVMCFLCLLFHNRLLAQCTSTATGTSWAVPSHWSGCSGGIPISSSNVVITTSTTLTLTTDVTIAKSYYQCRRSTYYYR